MANNSKLLKHLKKLYNLPDRDKKDKKPQLKKDVTAPVNTISANPNIPVPSPSVPTTPQYYGHYNTEGMTSIGPTFGQPQNPNTATGQLNSPSSRWKAQITKDTYKGLANYNNPTKVGQQVDTPSSWDTWRSLQEELGLSASPLAQNRALDRYNLIERGAAQRFEPASSSGLSDYWDPRILTDSLGDIPEDERDWYRTAYQGTEGSYPSSIGSPYTRQGADSIWNLEPREAATLGATWEPVQKPVLGVAGQTLKNVPTYLAKNFYTPPGYLRNTFSMGPKAPNPFTGFGKNILTGLKPTNIGGGVAGLSLITDAYQLGKDRRAAGKYHADITERWTAAKDEFIAAGGDINSFPPAPKLEDSRRMVRTARGEHLADLFEQGGILSDIGTAAGLVYSPYQIGAMMSAPRERQLEATRELGASMSRDPALVASQLSQSGSKDVPLDSRYDFSNFSPEIRDLMIQATGFEDENKRVANLPNQNLYEKFINYLSRAAPSINPIIDNPLNVEQQFNVRSALGEAVRQGDMSVDQLRGIVDATGLGLGRIANRNVYADPRIQEYRQNLPREFRNTNQMSPEQFHELALNTPSDLEIPMHIPVEVKQVRKQEQRDADLAARQEAQHREEEQALRSQQREEELLKEVGAA